MDILPGPERATHLAGGFAPHDPAILGTALRHLLGRAGDRPVRWTTPRFEAAVDGHRARLAINQLDDAVDAPGIGLTFEAAVRWLATDPAAVAIAVHGLETSGHRRLGPWRRLVRSGLPGELSDLDIALWFG